jgi:hypothetical protein
MHERLHPDVARRQQEWGLPGERLWERRLQYNTMANIVVLSFVVSRDGLPCAKVFLRRLSESKYRFAVPELGEDMRLESPVLSNTPVLFFIVSRWVRSTHDTLDDQVGLCRLEVDTGNYEIWKTDMPGPERFFLSELTGASADGRKVYAVAGFRSPGGIGDVNYNLVELDWETRTVDTRGVLDAVFF